MRKTIHTDELIEDAVEQYRIQHGLKSWSQAATELLVKALIAQGHWGDLREEWLKQDVISSQNYDPLADQDGDYSFERFITERVNPAWGGQRPDAGRKSSNRG